MTIKSKRTIILFQIGFFFPIIIFLLFFLGNCRNRIIYKQYINDKHSKIRLYLLKNNKYFLTYGYILNTKTFNFGTFKDSCSNYYLFPKYSFSDISLNASNTIISNPDDTDYIYFTYADVENINSNTISKRLLFVNGFNDTIRINVTADHIQGFNIRKDFFPANLYLQDINHSLLLINNYLPGSKEQYLELFFKYRGYYFLNHNIKIKYQPDYLIIDSLDLLAENLKDTLFVSKSKFRPKVTRLIRWFLNKEDLKWINK